MSGVPPPVNSESTAITAPAMYTYQLSRFSRGKATSSAPSCSGRMMLPRMAGMPGTMNRKIMITPCSVKKELYVLASMYCRPGFSSSRRIMMPRATPTRKKVPMAARYIRPMRLWSVVTSQDQRPVRPSSGVSK